MVIFLEKNGHGTVMEFTTEEMSSLLKGEGYEAIETIEGKKYPKWTWKLGGPVLPPEFAKPWYEKDPERLKQFTIKTSKRIVEVYPDEKKVFEYTPEEYLKIHCNEKQVDVLDTTQVYNELKEFYKTKLGRDIEYRQAYY